MHTTRRAFIAAAEYLVAERYTSIGKIAIYGHSNGGLLIGAVRHSGRICSG